MKKTLEPYQLIERSIIKKYRKELWTPFIVAVKRYELVQAGDRIVSVDGSEVATQSDLGTLMQEHSAGDTLSITVARDGQMQTVSLTLGEKNAANSGNGTNGASRQEKSAESAPQQNPQG